MSTNLSSLELMLVKIRQLDDQPEDEPPALPVRPVSRARRLPRARKQFAFHFRQCQENNGFNFFESVHDYKPGLPESDYIPIGMMENSKETAEKGALKIQKCYRGHQLRCNYNKLRRGVIALQSFVRGENSRKEYHHRVTAVIIIQRHIRDHSVLSVLKQRHEAVTCLQSGLRGWLSRRHFDHIKNEQKVKIENEIDVVNLPRDADMKGRVVVRHFVLVDLENRALKAEAKVREKHEENLALKMRLEKWEEKWREYEKKMNSMERNWQDKLTYIQTCLDATKKNPKDETIIGKFGQSDANLQRQNWDDGDRGRVAPHEIESCPSVELRKLKRRFTAWTKNFKNQLNEAEVISKRLGHMETRKGQKRWWERQMKKGISS